jgi:hypothetical protein
VNKLFTTQPTHTAIPRQWQPRHKSLKKGQKVAVLVNLTGHVSGQKCLLISGHDDCGAMHCYFRDAVGITQISDFLKDPRAHLDVNRAQYADDAFGIKRYIGKGSWIHAYFVPGYRVGERQAMAMRGAGDRRRRHVSKSGITLTANDKSIN